MRMNCSLLRNRIVSVSNSLVGNDLGSICAKYGKIYDVAYEVLGSYEREIVNVV